ncbi:MAG: TIGR03862 family flavoprotein [Devosiaceae bacterium]
MEPKTADIEAGPSSNKPTAVVIGSGPAGLMVADVLSSANVKVIICEAKPSVGRKFLMAGKSGLNLTKDEPMAAFLRRFYEAAPHLTPMLSGMGPGAVKRFTHDLGQEVFTGSSGRVFPKAMKASPLLRAWLARLEERGVEIRTRWRWTDIHDGMLTFDTPEGPQTMMPHATILALGGASWSRLGSDGTWVDILGAQGVTTNAFKPANMGFSVKWSAHMEPHFGTPVKGVRLIAGGQAHLGEFMISRAGLEGSGIYEVSRTVREGAPLMLDLIPNTKHVQAVERLSKGRGSDSLSNHLRKALKLSPSKRALLMEFGRPLPDGADALVSLVKALPVTHQGPRPLDEAISVAGGVAWDALEDTLMLRDMPGVFCAGEMLDWEAPTGGYLITGCLASGKWAGTSCLRWISKS